LTLSSRAKNKKQNKTKNTMVIGSAKKKKSSRAVGKNIIIANLKNSFISLFIVRWLLLSLVVFHLCEI